MKHSVQLTENAERDLDQILQWFHEQRAAAAGRRWLVQLLDQISTLERHPERCPRACEAGELNVDLRELLFGKRHGKYRILFMIRKLDVSVLHIRHSARDVVSLEDIC